MSETVRFLLPDAAEMRRTLEFAVQAVRPGMVLAAQRALNFHLVMHQQHAAMTADIVEDFDLVLFVAQDDQRQTHEVDRLDVAFLRQVAGKPQAGPSPGEHLVAFVLEESVAGIGLVG